MRDFFAGKNVEMLIDEKEIPGICVWHMELEESEMGHMSCRLEEAVTFIYMLHGNMTCQINSEKKELKTGNGIFINSHNAYRFTECTGNGCEFYVVSVKEGYLNADQVTAFKYVKPVIEETGLFSQSLDSEKKEQEEVLACVGSIGESAREKEAGYELEIRSLVFRMWLNLYRTAQAASVSPKKSELKEKAKLNRMLEFLHIHYKEKITLGEMAADSEVSTGEYCRFFKKRMEQTPFEYLQAYRIEKSLPEILEKSDSITKIALKHGFTGSSYYAETFKKEMGCAPGDYRKWYRGEDTGECPLKQVREQKNQNDEALKKPTEKVTVSRSTVRRESMPTHLL